MKLCYIFDVDGTVADASHRTEYLPDGKLNWNKFNDLNTILQDEPITHVINVAIALLRSGFYMVNATGRADDSYDLTKKYLFDNIIKNEIITATYHPGKWNYPLNFISTYTSSGFPLYMRKAGDHRSDEIVKTELYSKILSDGYQPLAAFEDRSKVVDMWRSLGLPCYQVAPGNF